MAGVVARGTIYLMVTQIIVLLSGYGLNVLFAYLFDATTYGNLGVILSLIMVTKTIFLTGIAKAVSKYLSEKKRDLQTIIRTGLETQIIFIIICVLLFMIFGDYLATKFNDPSLSWPIRISSLVVASVGIYVIYSDGYLNGLRKFKIQAFGEATHSVLRLVFSVLLVSVGFGIYGAILGYIIAPIIALITIRRYISIESIKDNPLSDKTEFSWKKILEFAIPINVFHSATMLSMEMGLFLVKGLLTNPALAGYYTASSTLAKITFSIFSALPLTLLPSVSMAFSVNNITLIKKYITQSIRYSSIILIFISIIGYAYARPILRLFYPDNFVVGSDVLFILMIGFSFFALMSLLSTVLSATGRNTLAGGIALIVLSTSIILNFALIPKYALIGAAIATLISGMFGCLITTYYIYRHFKIPIPSVSICRIICASTLTLLLSILLPSENLMFILYSVILGTGYLSLLIILREFKKEDFWIIKKMIKRK